MSCAVSNPKCTRCPLHREARHVCIPGRGSDHPDVVFVGQNPGQTEDQRGECFVGPAGRVLVEAIREYGIRPAWITNLVRCATPYDREPTGEEVKACRPYLDSELMATKPKIVVALGNVALKALTRKTGVTTKNGTVVDQYVVKNGVGSLAVPVFAMLHPAFILRSPGQLPAFKAGLRELVWYLHPEKKAVTPTPVPISPEHLDLFLKDMDFVAFDYETDGRAPEAGGVIRSVSFSDGKTRLGWMDLSQPGAVSALQGFLMSNVKKAAHNSVFEIRWSMERYKIQPRNLRYDTMLMHQAVDETRSHRLDLVAAELLDAPLWDIEPEFQKNGWTWATVPMDVLGKYNAIDSWWTAGLVRKLSSMMTEDQKRHYLTIQLPFAELCARMEARGIHIDTDWAKQVDALYRRRMEKIEKKFRAYPEVRKTEELFAKEAKGYEGFNLNSSKQMARLLYKVLRLPIPEETEKGSPSVREPALQRIKDKHPICADYLKWKSLKTLTNNYTGKFPAFVDERSLIHAGFNPGYIVSGRLSVTDPPLQTIPNDAEPCPTPDDPKHTVSLVRSMISSRFDGGMIANLDFSQLEIRLVASESGDEGLMSALISGEDIHSKTARELFGEKFTKAQRHIAKTLNFSVVYGASEYTLAAEFQMEIDEAREILNKFKKTKPAIFGWMARQHRLAMEREEIVSRFGRVRHLKGLKIMPERERKHALRQAGNFGIQSQGADCCALSCILVDEHFRAVKARSKLVLQVHDSLVIDLHPDEQGLVDMAKQIMEVRVPISMPWLKVPLKVDVQVSPRYGGAEEVPRD